MVEQSFMQAFDDRSTSFLAQLSSMFGGLTTDLYLGRIERGDAGQQPGGQRRLRDAWNWKKSRRMCAQRKARPLLP